MSMLSKLAVAASIADFAVKKFFFDLLKVDTVAATGSLISDAAVLKYGRNVVTAANGTKAVRLPKSEPDSKVEVVNTSATQALIVFPELAADQINAITAGASLTMPGGSSASFYCDAAGHWYAAVATAATADTAELAYLDGALSTNLVAEKAAILTTGGALTLGGALTAVTSIGIGSAVLSEAEMETLDGVTAGTLAASKVWTSDASLDTVMPTGGLLTIQSGGAVTLNSGSTLTASGAIVQAPVFVADATPYTVLAADSGKLHIVLEQTSSITLNLPAIAAGLSYKFVMGGVATEAQNWAIVATTPSFYNGGVAWTDTNAVASPVPVYGNGTSHLTLTVTTPGAGTAIEIYSNGTEWFVHGAVISDATPAFT